MYVKSFDPRNTKHSIIMKRIVGRQRKAIKCPNSCTYTKGFRTKGVLANKIIVKTN